MALFKTLNYKKGGKMNYEYVIGKSDRIVVAKIQPGAELVQSVLDICKELNISVAIINSFIGTIEKLYLRNPRDTTKLPITDESEFADQVDTTVLFRQMEIITIDGNIMKLDGELYPNLHGVFSEAGGNLRGGHIFRAIIWSQAEVVIQELKGELVKREMDEQIGIPQWQLNPPGSKVSEPAEREE